jgi:predicted metal-dependent hydrolase
MENDQQQVLSFQEQLEHRIGTKLQLKINDNRSTMLSVKWEPDCTKVSMHRMFLEAPNNIMQALTCYLKGEQKTLAPSIKAYIEVNLQKLDYSHELDLNKLQTAGKVHDLKAIYDAINKEYFENSLKMHITWFGKTNHRNRSRITFGLYYDPLKLIKINRLLDQQHFPEYVVAYVIYHEMLHFVCPTYVDEKGQKHIHSKAFKNLEKKFKHFELAEQWLKKHHNELFSSSLNF